MLCGSVPGQGDSTASSGISPALIVEVRRQIGKYFTNWNFSDQKIDMTVPVMMTESEKVINCPFLQKNSKNVPQIMSMTLCLPNFHLSHKK